MKRPARLAQEQAVGCILHECVFEEVVRMRWYAVLRYQISVDQTVEGRSKLRLRFTRHSGEKRMGEFAAQCGADLHDFLGWAKTIKPRRQRCMQACGDR